MSLEERLGIVVGKLEALGEQISEMRRSNSAEHADVLRRLDGMRAEHERRMEKLEERTRSLEGTRSEGTGAAKGLRVAQGIGVLVVMALPFVLGRGGV